ncbi:hypothetical protein MMC19_006192 [Ptychographa xylographoides]|nr:hypothetical protein [Ptychographa xylographoides]
MATTSALTCQEAASLGSAIDVIHGVSFHQLMTKVSAACTVFVCLLCFVQVAWHLSYYSRPDEQKLILRIVILPAVEVICALLSICFYSASPFVQNVPKVFEAVAICALFELYVVYLAPGSQFQREEYFQNLERYHTFSKKVKHTNGSLRWFQITWFCVFQFLFVTVATFVASEVAYAAQCRNDSMTKVTQEVIRVVASISTGVAVFGIIRLYHRCKGELKPHHALSKLISFKLLVLIEVVQSLLFGFINPANLPQPKPWLSFNDLTIGVLNLLLSCEMVIFTLLFAWYFSALPYQRLYVVFRQPRLGDAPPLGESRIGFGRAILHALNSTDLFQSLWLSATYLFKLPFGKNYLGYDVEGGKAEKEVAQHPQY